LEALEVRAFLKTVFLEVSREKGFEIIECEILSDHVHLLIDQSYMLSTSMVVKNLKGVSSRRLFQKYKTNRGEIRKLWGRSFDARKIDSNQKEVVINYIKNQMSPVGVDKRF
ncbi:MAG: IS200/IS605 family transposase, partial [Candidatus Saganbacteria bacterium]|nr:IS200/IS605 family transposase [Candidatus Saganbacteria bacterium]